MHPKMFLGKEWMFLVLIVLLGLTACSPNDATAPSLTPASEASFDIIGGTDEQLRELVAHIMSPNYPGAATNTQVELFVGTLPDQLPLELPLPEGATLIGSMTTIGRDQNLSQIVLETSASPQDVNSFYETELMDLGFAVQEQQGSGFVQQYGSWYCRASDELFLQLLLSEADRDASEGKTDVQIHIQSEMEYSPCNPENAQLYADPQTSLLPALTSPPSAVLHEGGGGGSGGRSGDSSYTFAVVEVDQSLEELADYYSVQLRDAGWETEEQSHTELTSWVSWSLSSQDNELLTGLLLVIPGPYYPEMKYVLLRVDPK